MMSEQWSRRVRELFEKVRHLGPDKRREVLDEECAGDPAMREEIESLLEHHEDPDEDPIPVLNRADRDTADAVPIPSGLKGMNGNGNGHPDRIGSYRILHRLGHGGMGDVFLGERDDGHRKCTAAIKVIRPGIATEDILRRFAQERLVLGALDHPNIARLEDAGQQDGLPYVAIEYVDGAPINQHCDENKLSVEKRLELFQKVCAALAHAHDNLIIHRDLKPSHILITGKGEPKLLDFGIAKLLNRNLSPDAAPPTVPGRGIMTPEYASPEQIRGRTPTCKSDVYALGVILYELLTGHRPYRFKNRYDQEELERVVCKTKHALPSDAVTQTVEIVVDPTTGETDTITPEEVSLVREGDPDRLRRRLAGDLDNIVLKAMHQDPEQRYEGMLQLSEDIQRHLDSEPVKACPDSYIYRTKKFIKRHRVGVSAAAVVALALVLGMTSAVWGKHTADTQRDLAEERLELVQELVGVFLQGHDKMRFLDAPLATREVLVETAVEAVETVEASDGLGDAIELGGDPRLIRLLAEGHNRLGDTRGGFREPGGGNLQAALNHHRKAFKCWDALVRASPDDGELQVRLAACLIRIGDALRHTGELSEALNSYKQAYATLEPVEVPDPRRHRSIALKSQGPILLELGRVSDAETIYQDALAISLALAAEPAEINQRNLSVSWIKVGEVQRAQGLFEDALASFKEALRIRKRLLEKASPTDAKARERVAKALLVIGITNLDLGRLEAARNALREANALFVNRANDNPDVLSAELDLIRTRLALAQLSLLEGQAESARGALESAQAHLLEMMDDANSTNVPVTFARACQRLSEVLIAIGGNAQAAVDELHEARDVLSRLLITDSESVDLRTLKAEIETALGRLLLEEERWSEADQRLRSADSMYRALVQKYGDLASVRDGLAETMHAMSRLEAANGRTAGASRLAEEALELVQNADWSVRVDRLRSEIVADLKQWE